MRIAHASRRRPPIVWVPLASAIALGVAGGLSLLTGELFLFASLGPTALMMTHHPDLVSSRPYNAVVGHMVGLGAGLFCAWVLGLGGARSVFVVHAVSGTRVAAALLGIAIASILEIALKAQHPPGAATTLLGALGSFKPHWHVVWAVFVGIAAVALTSELLKRLREELVREPLSSRI